MDVDYLNSSSDPQMDLISMMMNMEDDKLAPSPDSSTQLHYFSPPIYSEAQLYHPPPPPSFSAAAELSFRQRRASVAAMREMIFRVAAMQPVHIDPESVRPPKRRNVRISSDPQSVAARHRRERISERMRILQHLVPGGTKMDTASMLDEAIHYVKFLKTQVQSLERAAAAGRAGFPPAPASYSCFGAPEYNMNVMNANVAGGGVGQQMMS